MDYVIPAFIIGTSDFQEISFKLAEDILVFLFLNDTTRLPSLKVYEYS